jgi:hypothetical protein
VAPPSLCRPVSSAECAVRTCVLRLPSWVVTQFMHSIAARSMSKSSRSSRSTEHATANPMEAKAFCACTSSARRSFS